MQWRRIAISDEGANEPGGAITRTLTFKGALTYISIGMYLYRSYISIGTSIGQCTRQKGAVTSQR